ncbi:cell division control protein [Diplodia corticola]|uniref:Cell division control protein n=1 Tax=Diplodia corticola TaxID=236234 RepID=A0A1J9RHW6_9PEZI|nr:cell division control protein [Diplodia corticola]OJD40025.1 cell division control protein [Diplodia corticola]
MPGTTVSDPPSVSLSFANNFWGKDDAGVTPLLERMHSAKVTGDELKSFYTARAHIEEEYARKLLNLSRKPLGSSEAGTLKMSLDVVRAEIELMGKQHQQIAGQMKSELEEQLSAFTGGLKERRKIVQTGIEKLLKVKMQQTSAVNKARDRYEQDCLKIKGYLAQGHMVMGHEERKNKAKLEKTQVQLSGSSQEYEQAVKILEETTSRWNREWKKACDNFQDFEEERLDFMKSSLWAFANIASTVCVSDDASLEKIRLSLEDCEVEKDITNFIRDCGTGQEIPDPPKFIDFCRGDAADDASMTSEDNNYTVAQFARTMNPAFRSASPQPSLFESHHDPNNPLARELAHRDGNVPASSPIDPPPSARTDPRAIAQAMQEQYQSQYGEIPQIPHNAYPADGMTQFCRVARSERGSSISSPARPDSRDSRSDLSAPTSFTSADPASGAASPIKQADDPMTETTPVPRERAVLKKKSGFFQGGSPFKRKSRAEESGSPASTTPTGRNSWSAPSAREGSRPPYGRQARTPILGGNDAVSASPEPDADPVDPRANFQLNVGKNVFDVASPDKKQNSANPPAEEQDPIAAALAELKAPSKQTSVRMTADRYAGLATPAPSTSGAAPLANSNASRGAPPPSYEQPMSRLGAPQPAHTAKQMQQTTQSYVKQTQNMFNPRASGGSSRPSTRGSQDVRGSSPAPGPRATSPRPGFNNRATSPNPYAAPAGGNRPRAQSTSPVKPREWGSWNSRQGDPGNGQRAVSPQPQYSRPGTRTGNTSPAPHFGGQGQRPASSAGGAMVLAPSPSEGGSQRTGRSSTRPMSYYGGSSGGGGGEVGRVRSRSVAADARYTSTGALIMHYSRALYMYQAQIPEELTFNKGDVLAITREQDDGWWEAEVLSKPGRLGLVPSNYLQNC